MFGIDLDDGRYLYDYSPYGIEVLDRKLKFKGYYKVRYYCGDKEKPTRLVLMALSYGNCPAEIIIDCWYTLGDIENYCWLPEAAIHFWANEKDKGVNPAYLKVCEKYLAFWMEEQKLLGVNS